MSEVRNRNSSSDDDADNGVGTTHVFFHNVSFRGEPRFHDKVVSTWKGSVT